MIAWPVRFIGEPCPALLELSPEDRTAVEEWAGELLTGWVHGTYGYTQWQATQLCSPTRGCSGGCTYNGVLLRVPVASIDLVTSDGVEVGEDTWEVCDGRFQWLDEAPPNWAITYTAGRKPPLAGQIAAGLLACELAKSVAGDQTCSLPRTTSSVTRTGITILMSPENPQQTGIWDVDSWVDSVGIPAAVVIPHQRCVQTVKVAP